MVLVPPASLSLSLFGRNEPSRTIDAHLSARRVSDRSRDLLTGETLFARVNIVIVLIKSSPKRPESREMIARRELMCRREYYRYLPSSCRIHQVFLPPFARCALIESKCKRKERCSVCKLQGTRVFSPCCRRGARGSPPFCHK